MNSQKTKEKFTMKNRVYELRVQKGWSLKQLSIKSGVGKSAINNFENGKTDNPSIETITGLAKAFNVSVDELFEEKKPKTIVVKRENCPNKTKEEYIAELQDTLSKLETYKVRYFYIFTMVKLGVIPYVKSGV